MAVSLALVSVGQDSAFTAAGIAEEDVVIAMAIASNLQLDFSCPRRLCGALQPALHRRKWLQL